MAALTLCAVVAAPSAAAPTGVQVSGWARPTVAGQSSGAAYLVIRNYGPGADQLIAVASPAAGMASIHRSQLAGGVSRMRPAGAIVIPPGKMLTMGPNGVHVMLMGLKAPLKAGTTMPLSLWFKRGGTRLVHLTIQMSAPDDRPHQR